MSANRSPRIVPLSPPYTPEIAAALAKWMPPNSNLEPLKLFRTLLHNQEISSRMHPLGAGILGAHSSLDRHEREILIDRTCARCGCEYEWGVHVALFGEACGFSQQQLAATAIESVAHTLWSERESLLIELVDELHETATLSDEVWEQLAAQWSSTQILEMMIIVGWYHLIAFVANAVQVEQESWAAHFPASKKG